MIETPADDDGTQISSPLERLPAEAAQELARLDREQLTTRLGLSTRAAMADRLERAEALLTQVREWISGQLSREHDRVSPARAARELSQLLGWSVTASRDAGPHWRPGQVITWRDTGHDDSPDPGWPGRDIVGGPDDVTGNSS